MSDRLDKIAARIVPEQLDEYLPEVQHSCPYCKCQPHRALLDWTDRDKGTVQTWIGTCVCGWRGTPFTTWMGAMSEAENHVERLKGN
jgi:hypothetical protein